MKKIRLGLCIIVILTFTFSSIAFAATSLSFSGILLEKGVEGKRQTPDVTKGGATGSAGSCNITYLSRTLSKTDCINAKVYRASNSNAVTGLGTMYSIKDSPINYNKDSNGNSLGINGVSYFQKMQNTTGMPGVTVSGKFTP
jgi:hypothetical protein